MNVWASQCRKPDQRPRPIQDREVTFGSINTPCRHLPAYTGSNTSRRGKQVEPRLRDDAGVADLLMSGRSAGGNRDRMIACATRVSKRAISPNDAYAAMVAAAGYLPVTRPGRTTIAAGHLARYQ